MSVAQAAVALSYIGDGPAQQIIAENRGDPSTLAVETTIPLGSNTPGSDNNGRADITWDDGTNVWIWEVKGPESDNPDRFVIQATLASSEAATYVKRLQDSLPSDPEEERYRMVRLGFPLTAPPSPTYTNWTGKTEDLPLSNSAYGDGGIIYQTKVQPDTTTGPPLPPATPPTTPTTRPPGPGTPQSSTTAPVERLGSGRRNAKTRRRRRNGCPSHLSRA